MGELPAWQRWWGGELAYSPRRGRHALKVGLASTIALVFAVRYDWPHPSWTLMMILPGMMPVLGAAIQIVMARLAAVLLGGVASLLVFGFIVQNPVMLSVVIGLIIFAVIYGVTGPGDPTVFVNVGITIPVVVLVSFSLHEQLEVIVFDRVVTLMLGAIIGLAVSVALWPVRALDEFRASVHRAFSTAKETLDARFEDLLAGAARGGEALASEQISAQRMITHLRLLGQARAERRHGEDLSPRYLRAVGLVESLLGTARSFRLSKGISMAEAPEPLREALARARTAVERTLAEHEQGLAGEAPWPPSTAALDDAVAHLEEVLDDMWGASTSGGAVALRFSSLVVGLREVRRGLGELVEEITILRQLRAGDRKDRDAGSGREDSKPRWKNLLRIDAERVRMALKGAIAGLAAFYVSEGLDIFPVLAMTFAIIVASAATTATARLAAIVIFSGVSLGIGLAWVATIFLVPHLEALPVLARLPGLTIICALVFSCVGYLMGGRHLAPVALFMGIFFGVLFVTGQPKVTTLDSHWTFFVSICTAMVVGLAVNYLVWPVTATGKLRQLLAGFLESVADMGRAVQEADPDLDAYHAKYRRFAAQYYNSIGIQLKLAVAAAADKAVTKAQVAHGLGLQQRLFDVSFALARLRTQSPAAGDAPLADAQHALNEATVGYLDGLAERVRSPGSRPALPELRSALQGLIRRWIALREDEESLAALSTEDVRTIRTSIERRALMVDALHEFNRWLDAQESSSSPTTVLAVEQR